MAAFSATLNGLSCFRYLPKIEVKAESKWRLGCAVRSQHGSSSGNSGRSHRRVWRRRKLAKKDDMLDYRMERIPFLEEQVRKIRETGELLTMDIERLLLSEDNRFGFVNEVAAEAKQYVESNRDEYGAKKAIFHVLSNRMNDSGFYRPEAYIEDDPFKPGPGYLRQQLYDV
ncbi:protein PLASTID TRANSCRIPTIONALLY ACTIVE 7 [Sesamum angolense]|uniref:Protein PLASTID TRANSCRIPTIONALLY ACTIVE 7 n=1 Tax=Sesamum angolense TaxID=2727404 RepID=A0AAE1VZE2_9LAMI|nr:protein PLASTID TRANSCRIPTIONALLY ACTIVE 7 [Sesamum angolense]